MEIQQIIAVLFQSRDAAHKAHLNTDSYAAHMALGGFYDDIIDAADKLAEAWMGRNLKKIGEIQTLKTPQGDILGVLQKQLQVIQTLRDFANKDTTISNIIDEIEALYLSVIYKLKFLK